MKKDAFKVTCRYCQLTDIDITIDKEGREVYSRHFQDPDLKVRGFCPESMNLIPV